MYLYALLVPMHPKKHAEFPDYEIINTQIQVGYWRKANHIHGWFVRNTLDPCGEGEQVQVSREQLMQLLMTCKTVRLHHSLAEAMLPPMEGFLFGSTEIDDEYFEQIDETIELLEKALAQDFSKYKSVFMYRADW